MRQTIQRLADEYTHLFATPRWALGAGIGFFGVFLADAINRIAGIYATKMALLGGSIHDVLLDAIPKVNTSWLHFHAMDFMTPCTLVLIFLIPRRLPMVLMSCASIVVARAVFINMTHLGLYRDAQLIMGSATTWGGDLFFSGHVAIPFILALVFWEEKWIRYAFFAVSLLLGVESIIGHYHYSIDVFAAPFIAYGVYRFLFWLFPSLSGPRA